MSDMKRPVLAGDATYATRHAETIRQAEAMPAPSPTAARPGAGLSTAMSGDNKTSRAQREDILRIARQREKVAKSEARRRSSELKADFENKLASHFSFDQSAVWAQAVHQADLTVKEMDQRIAAECEKLGIPRQFRPGISLSWYSRGQNASRERRAELRKVADTRIAALEKRAFEEIERQNLNFQTNVLSLGLTSPEAQRLLAEMPTTEQLMPPLNLRDVILALTKGPEALPFSRYDALPFNDDESAA